MGAAIVVTVRVKPCEGSFLIDCKEGDRVHTLSAFGRTFIRISKPLSNFNVADDNMPPETVIASVNFQTDLIQIKWPDVVSQAIYEERRLDIALKQSFSEGQNVEYFVIEESRPSPNVRMLKDGSVWVRVTLL